MVMISGGIEVRSETQRVGLKEPSRGVSKAAYGGTVGRATMWAHTGTDKISTVGTASARSSGNHGGALSR